MNNSFLFIFVFACKVFRKFSHTFKKMGGGGRKGKKEKKRKKKKKRTQGKKMCLLAFFSLLIIIYNRKIKEDRESPLSIKKDTELTGIAPHHSEYIPYQHKVSAYVYTKCITKKCYRIYSYVRN